MASTATTRNRFEKQGTGDNVNSWGLRLNTSGLDLIDSAMDGMAGYTLSGSRTLTSTNYAADESRMRFQKITGGTGGTVTIPANEKFYVVRNNASGNVIFTTGGGVTSTVPPGQTTFVVCDGTNVYTIDSATHAASAEAAKVAAEAALAAALIAETNAELAETNAETAETNAETAETAAASSASSASASAAAAAATLADAIAAGSILPVQTGNAGKVLTTNGTTTSWAGSHVWVQLGSTITTTGAGPWDFSSIAAIANGYRELMLYCEFTVAGASPSNFTPRIRIQGTSGIVATADFGVTLIAGNTGFLQVELDDCANEKGIVFGAQTANAPPTIALTTTARQALGDWQVAGGVNLLGLVSQTGTATVSAMSLKLFRRG